MISKCHIFLHYWDGNTLGGNIQIVLQNITA